MGLAAVGGGVLLLMVIMFLMLRGSSDPTGQAAKTEPATAVAPIQYVPKGNRTDTVLATLAANGLPSFQGKWHVIGPFDNPGSLEGFDRVYPPQTEIDLKKSYPGKGKRSVAWKEVKVEPGKPLDLKIIPDSDQSCVYLYHEFDTSKPTPMVVGFGSDDSLQVWFNGQQVIANKASRGVVPDQDLATLTPRTGRNQLLAKVCNGSGSFGFYIMPRWPASLDSLFGASLQRDFPK
jgi:hypothetical protein